jgi:rhodanese-related sulfurtransferase
MPTPTEEAIMAICTAWQTLLLSVLALFAIPSGAAPIIDAAAVKAAQARGAIIWDTRATPLYRKGHIPGAVSIGDAGNVLRNPVTEDFIETAQIEKILGNAGIDPARKSSSMPIAAIPMPISAASRCNTSARRRSASSMTASRAGRTPAIAVETADAQLPASRSSCPRARN